MHLIVDIVSKSLASSVDTEDLVKGVAALAAATGAFYTARQFLRTRRWRHYDLAHELVEVLGTDEELSFACHVTRAPMPDSAPSRCAGYPRLIFAKFRE